MIRARLCACAALLVLGAVACSRSSASPHDSTDTSRFFRGQTLTYIVATAPGGGYDTYGRLVSKHLGRHLGAAAVVVRNVPGGGHSKGALQIYRSRPDGLTLGSFSPGPIYPQLLGTAGELDLRRMSWIEKAGGEARVLTVSRQSGFRSVADIRGAGRPLIVGANGVSGASYNDVVLVAHALGIPIRLVLGMDSNAAQLSMMRGEIEAEFGSYSSYRRFVRNGDGRVVVKLGEDDEIDPSIPDAATLVETAEGQALVDLVAAQASLARWTAGPPGIPAERLQTLRQAYMTTLQDPAFLQEARKLQLPVRPVDGATLAAEIDRALTQPPQTMTLVRTLLSSPPR